MIIELYLLYNLIALGLVGYTIATFKVDTKNPKGLPLLAIFFLTLSIIGSFDIETQQITSTNEFCNTLDTSGNSSICINQTITPSYSLRTYDNETTVAYIYSILIILMAVYVIVEGFQIW